MRLPHFLHSLKESIYHKLTEFRREACEIRGKARDSYDEIRVSLWVCVCLKQLLLIEQLLAAVFLDNDDLYRFYNFKPRKALLTREALASAANTVPLHRGSGINYLTFGKSATRTSHVLYRSNACAFGLS